MKPSETELVARFQRGEGEAFAEVYRDHGTAVYRFCWRLCGRHAWAEDLAQETFVAAFQGRERFEGRAKLRTWLYRIALFTYRASLRQENRLPTVSLNEDVDEPRHDGDPTAGVVFQQALAKLPEEQREAFLLVRVEGLTHREAAEVLGGVPCGTVQAWVFRAAQALRRDLGQVLDDDQRKPRYLSFGRMAW